MIDIRPASWPQDRPVVERLFRDYAAGLGIDPSFQGFEAELCGLPGRYAAPQGCVLLAWHDEDPLGCVALRALGDGGCEMKRLYVRPAARGAQLGRRLVERLCAQARAAGYARICLDTLPTMAAAQALYRSLGFTPVAPYVFNPIEGAQYLGRAL